jgi:hypothetical protein
LSAHNNINFFKMFKYVLLAAFLGLAVARPQNKPQDEVTIIKSENENNGDGTFRWATELSDGTKSEQSGYIKPGDDPENAIQVMQGSYSYYTPEGELISVTYVADENGFQPQGEHLPTPPPIPEAIQKALDIIYANIESQKTKK